MLTVGVWRWRVNQAEAAKVFTYQQLSLTGQQHAALACNAFRSVAVDDGDNTRLELLARAGRVVQVG
ncbi:hypothetical protein CKJ67_14185 [Mycobacterium intracellulare]|nr:hypothetical protein CKJ67_14185 [Mycobacterium intracellulare]PBA22674.1 hypothetical protein CKJ68_14220 [Mycobacterium intracellulare]